MLDVLIFVGFIVAVFGVVWWMRWSQDWSEDDDFPERREFWLEDFRSDDGEDS